MKRQKKDVFPEDAGPNLRRCIKRWSLMPPYNTEAPDEHWAAYYAERATLEKS